MIVRTALVLGINGRASFEGIDDEPLAVRRLDLVAIIFLMMQFPLDIRPESVAAAVIILGEAYELPLVKVCDVLAAVLVNDGVPTRVELPRLSTDLRYGGAFQRHCDSDEGTWTHLAEDDEVEPVLQLSGHV